MSTRSNNRSAWRSGAAMTSELHRRSDFSRAVARALDAMRAGLLLHMEYRAGHPIWSLGGGQAVSAAAAAIIISSANVVPVGDSLFPDMPGQTWRIE